MTEDIPRPFWDHIEELRFRVLRCLAATAIGTVIGFWMVTPVLRVLAKPVGHFVFLQPTEAFFVRLKIALGIGIVLAVPWILHQIWQFAAVAIPLEERKIIRIILPVSYLLFLAGFLFGFFFLVPAGIKFLLSYSSPELVAMLSIESYVSFVNAMCLTLGAVAQMPLVSLFLGRFGILDWQFLSDKRRTAILIIYIASALLTPGPDPVTAILLAIPTYILFECSIWTCRWAQRKTT